MISIIIPVYNQAEKLAKCLASITAQSYQDFEIIIVNDGSSDDPRAWYEAYKGLLNDKISLIDQSNQGSNPARNRGAREARGQFLLFCDADIIMKPEMLQLLLSALTEHPDKAYAYSGFKFGFKTFAPGDFSADKLRAGPFIHTSALMRTEAFPGFDNQIKRFQDWDLWLTILERGGEGIFVNEMLFEVASGGTISTWLPSFVYKLMPWLPAVKKYQRAMAVVKAKHGIV